MAASSPQHSSISSLRDPINDRSSTAPSPTKSVQFSSRDNSMARSPTSRSIDDRQPAPTQAHGRNGPADEITPIVSNERSGGKRNYATTSEDSEGMTAGQASAGSPGPRPLAMKNSRQFTAEADGKESDGWWKDLMDKYGTMELENKGSVARDHLALERTFLAWLRTSLAFASIGIAITQLFRLNTTISQREGFSPKDPGGSYHLRQVGKPLGATFMGIAIVLLIVGARRYFESQYWIIRGKFPASRGSIFLVTLIAAALIIASLVIVCTVDPTIFEKR
ncbi:MAG: hypothetical protein Q9171_006344 [Xanthocarpia ochracea]